MLTFYVISYVASVSVVRLPRRQVVSIAAGSLFAPGSASAAAKSRSDPSYEVRKSDAEWREALSGPQYFILRQGGTERPNSSPLVHEKRVGVFLCAGCGEALFSSREKFESGTGWPSFASGIGVEVERVAFDGMYGAELRCRRCGGHLGDRFKDGAFFPGTRAAETGYRYCIDGAALVFVPEEGEPMSGDFIANPLGLPKWLQPPRVV